MKSEKIINAWDKIEPDDETKQQIFSKIMSKQTERRTVFKPTKIIATAAAVVLIIGLINVQTVIAFIGGLFFAPGVGLTTDINISYAGLDKLVDIKTPYGTFLLEFATKITQNGKTNLSLFLDSQDLPYYGWEKLNITFGMSVKNRILIPEDKPFTDEHWRSGGWATAGEHHISFGYTYENFPNVKEFDLTVCGIKTHILLKNQKIADYVLSEENNGVTMVLCKLGADNLVYQGFFDKDFDNEKYSINIDNYFTGDHYFYDINGNKLDFSDIQSIGGTGFDDGYYIYKIKNNSNGVLPEIKGFKSDSAVLSYGIKSSTDIEIPVPKDGEIIKTDIEIPFGQYIYKITEVWRRGDSIYFEDNGIKKIETIPKNETTPYWSDSVQIIPGTPEYEKAVSSREAIIRYVSFDSQDAAISDSRGRTTIKNFDENAETIKIRPLRATIIQYGNFDAEFN
ncbi:MAG: hypothetical protein FWD71_16735 [Oscillospiraceae bacterium]|nr:hypothetical protein [Oscillospiraceae bacterium]